jgi:hypothetical protein
MVKPISLRIRAHEATARARQLLRDLDEKDRLRRRVRWLATKALVSVRELSTDAGTLKSGSGWQSEIKLVESILVKISKTGVG